ncbi:hypothetical protein [Georgenia sp.]
MAVTKIASAGLATKISVGAVAAVVGVSSAAAGDVLPRTSQDTVASIIEATTPFDVPDSTDDAVELVDDAEVPADDALETGTTEPTGGEPADSAATEDGDTAGEAPEDGATEESAEQTFGSLVSEDARDGGVDGQEISRLARAAHQPAQAQGSTRSTRAPVEEDPDEKSPEVPDEEAPEAPEAPDDGASIPATVTVPPTDETVAVQSSEPAKASNSKASNGKAAR